MPDIAAHFVFRDVVLLYPVATMLHVMEEWPRFPRWARRFASSRYSDRRWAITHAATIGLAIATTVLVRTIDAPWIAFGFFAFVFGPGVLWNAMFHVAASVRTRTYCAGALSGLVLYLPLAAVLGALVVREGRLGGATLAMALAVAAAFHVLEVGHDVFERW